MGNKKNADKWLPADHLRVMAFARSLVPDSPEVQLGQEPKTSDIQEVLSRLAHPIDISAPTIRSWVVGETLPSVSYVNWIKQGMPECADWLKPDIESSPIRRFLCALDMWGAPSDSPIRKLDTTSKGISVGKGFATMAMRWAPKPIGDKRGVFCGIVIPKPQCPVPPQVDDSVYQSINRLSLMDFMFRCGPYLELSDVDFREWAIDLASLTLMTGAFFEGMSLPMRLQSGRTGDYSSLVFDIFFRPHGNWPNWESVRGRLEDFPELDDSVIDKYSRCLVKACDALNNELLAIGSDLSVAKKISAKIKDGDRMWQEPIDAHGETFAQSDLLPVKRNISPVAPGRYKYEFRKLSDRQRTVLCHDLESGTQTHLVERPDLYDGYLGSFSWGYSGEGPTFLAISLLAHHLGHDDFGSEETDRLLGEYISRFSDRLSGVFFLTTDLIDRCLNK